MMLLLEYQAPDGHLWRFGTDRLPDESHDELIRCACLGNPQAPPSYIGATGLRIRTGFVRATPVVGSAPCEGHPLSDAAPADRGTVLVNLRDAFGAQV